MIDLLQTELIPVAIDQAYQRRQQDSEGEFYRKIAGQGPRSDFKGTTQGFYLATPAGELLLYNNNRDPDKLVRLTRQALREFESRPDAADAKPIHAEKRDPRFNPKPPSGGLVVRVRAKVLDGYPSAAGRWDAAFQRALSRDNLWITAVEHQALVAGRILPSLQRRMARYHLVDNTRGEPPMWSRTEIKSLEMKLTGDQLTGSVQLKTDSGDRGYEAALRGVVEVTDGQVTRFDVVCLGQFWGAGPFTGNAPPGKFPLAIGFELADGKSVADTIPPQGSRGWVQGYLK